MLAHRVPPFWRRPRGEHEGWIQLSGAATAPVPTSFRGLSTSDEWAATTSAPISFRDLFYFRQTPSKSAPWHPSAQPPVPAPCATEVPWLGRILPLKLAQISCSRAGCSAPCLLAEAQLLPGCCLDGKLKGKSECVGCNISLGSLPGSWCLCIPVGPQIPPRCDIFIYYFPKPRPDAGTLCPLTPFFLQASCSSRGRAAGRAARVHLGGRAPAHSAATNRGAWEPLASRGFWPHHQKLISHSVCLIFLTCSSFPVLQGQCASGSPTWVPYLQPSRCWQQLKCFITSCFWWQHTSHLIYHFSSSMLCFFFSHFWPCHFETALTQGPCKGLWRARPVICAGSSRQRAASCATARICVCVPGAEPGGADCCCVGQTCVFAPQRPRE